jgi:competence protein ComEC
VNSIAQLWHNWQRLTNWQIWFGVSILCAAGILISPLQNYAWPALFGIAAVYFLSGIITRRIMPILTCVFLLAAALWTFSFLPRTLPPELPESFYNQRIWVVGQITQIKNQPTRTQLTLSDIKAYQFSEESRFFNKIRVITNANRLKEVAPGDWYALHVKFLPPTPPETGFDSRKYLQKQNLSATSILWGSAHKITPQQANFAFLSFEKLRHKTFQHYENKGETGALAASLIVGKREGLVDEIRENFRASGLAHLLSISGLHVGLIAVLGFWISRFILIRLPNASTLPIKTMAGIIGAIMAILYAGLAGFSLPTIRAASMLSVAYLAWMTGRYNQGIKGLSLIAGILILIWPFNVASASFQMSFSATFALLLWGKYSDDKPPPVLWLQAIHYIRNVIFISFIATLATMPFILWHFNVVSLNGVFANALAVPLLAFWVLPSGLLDLILTPIHLDFLSWPLFSTGLNTLLWVADIFNNEPLGSLTLPKAYHYILLPLCLAVIIAFSLKKWVWGWVGCAIILSTFIGSNLWPKPTKLYWLSESSSLILADGNAAYLLNAEGSNIAPRRLSYLSRYIDQRFKQVQHKPQSYKIQCDTTGCSFTFKNQALLILEESFNPTPEDCRLGSIIFRKSNDASTVVSKCRVYEGQDFQMIWSQAKGWHRIEAL